jgi:hypothetical protein
MKMLLLSALAVSSFVLVAHCASAEVLVFDMGNAESAVWPGAERVTASDSRWQAGGSLVEHDGPNDGDPVWTNPLTQDAVTGSGPTSFAFRAGPGAWSVYVLCGFGGRWDAQVSQVWDFDVAVGGQQWRCQIAAPSWRGPHLQRSNTFQVESTGAIEIELIPRSQWCVLGIVAWPASEGEEARKLIGDIEQWAPSAELAKWREDVRPAAGPPLAPDAAALERGFVVWRRHWATPIYPWTNPTPHEVDPVLRVFAAPGEYEPVTFTVRPLRDLEQARIEVRDVGPVPEDEVDVRKVRYVEARPNYNLQGLYRVVPDVLERWQGGPLAQDENATFWLTIRVPDDAPPGVYASDIAFIADGQRVKIPVLLRVLDVELQEDPERTYGIYYRHPLSRVGGAPDEVSRRYWARKAELEHADMVAHGTRSITLSIWAEGMDDEGKFPYIDQGFALLEDQLAMARRFEFQPPYVLSISSNEVYRKHTGVGLQSHLKDVAVPPEAFFAEITELVRTIEGERQRRGWPEFVYQPYDEPSADPVSVRFMARLMEAVKAAGVRVYTTAAPEKPAYEPFKPLVDVWCTQTFLPDHDTVVADSRARGVEYWCYPNKSLGENDHTTVAGARMTYGFGFWRSGFVRLIPWIYQYEHGDPFNYLDGSMMDFLVRSEPDGTPIPVAIWEAFREGYDDMRYIHSLRRAIAQAADSGLPRVRAEAQEAQQVLDSVWTAIPVRAMYQYEGFWSPEEMDVYRWLIAERLERLTRLLAEDDRGYG